MPCHGLNNFEWYVLDILGKNKSGLTVTEIGRIGKIKRGTNKLLQELKHKGFVEEKDGKFFSLKNHKK